MQPDAPRTIARAINTLKRHVGLLHTQADLHPCHELSSLEDAPDCFEATGFDPHFRLRRQLAAGWYMAEVQLGLPVARAQARFYVDSGAGESETKACGLPLRAGRVAKRLLWLEQASSLRFDPTTAPGRVEVQQFHITRVSARFASRRMRRKLLDNHPLHGQGSGAEIEALPKSAEASALWPQYNQLFERVQAELMPYADWIRLCETPSTPDVSEQLTVQAAWAWRPLISIVVPTYNSHEAHLRACLDSVLAQSYPHWELCIADDASTQAHVRETIEAYASREPRIRFEVRTENGHIALASNSALALASGEFVALLDHDDTLAPHALHAVVQALQLWPSAQLIYSDEDKLGSAGERCDPYFKPDWAPELLRAQNYVSHLGVYKRTLVNQVGGFRAGFEGSQDHDLVLRCTARIADTQDIVHVPQVLYHWRKAEGSTAAAAAHKPYTSEAARRALQEQADAFRTGATVSIVAPGLYRHHWPLPDPAPLVSLIVPTRDAIDVLRPCIESILNLSTYTNYEILIVDNQSSDPETLAWLSALVQGQAGAPAGKVRVLRYDEPFNFAGINNFAAEQAAGSVLALLNNDVEVLSPDWLGEMVSLALRADIGCVGAKLYYPDGTIQHAGVVLGIGGVAGHSHKYFPGDAEGYFSRLRIVHEVSAVTAAALVVRKAVWQAAGGMDADDLHVAFNDVDFCIKVRELGLRNLFTPFAELVHHESRSRGTESTPAKQARFAYEKEVMQKRWKRQLSRDIFYSPHLSRTREDYSLAGADIEPSHV